MGKSIFTCLNVLYIIKIKTKNDIAIPKIIPCNPIKWYRIIENITSIIFWIIIILEYFTNNFCPINSAVINVKTTYPIMYKLSVMLLSTTKKTIDAIIPDEIKPIRKTVDWILIFLA